MPALAVTTGASLLTGWLGSRASNSAANMQNQAAQQAAQASLQAGQTAAGGVNDATTAAMAAAQQGTQQGIGAVNDATGQANQTLAGLIQQITGNQAGYTGAGNQAVQSLAQMFAPGGAGTQQFSFSGEDFRNTPGYQFSLEEGNKAIERSAAARGGLKSGSTLKALSRFNIGTAEQAYGNAFNRAQSAFQMNRENQVNPLLALAGMGQTATQNVNAATANLGSQQAGNTADAGRFTGSAQMNLGQLLGQLGVRGAESAGGFLTNATGQANEALMGGANARAAGRVGAANSWNNTIGGIAGNVGGWLTGRNRRGGGGFQGYDDSLATFGGR